MNTINQIYINNSYIYPPAKDKATNNKLNIKANNSDILTFFENRMKELQRTPKILSLPSELKFKPFMSYKDSMALSSFMKPGNIYFEFGSGGSTNLASFYKLKVYSVESDSKWHNKLKENNINATYLTVDLNARAYGYPGPNTNVEDWKKYIQAYKSEYNADIVLIDGRFRIVCGLDIFSKIRNDTLVLIHDYNRKYYHILENYYIKIKSWDILSAFFKNPNVDSIPKTVFDKYLYEPR